MAARAVGSVILVSCVAADFTFLLLFYHSSIPLTFSSLLILIRTESFIPFHSIPLIMDLTVGIDHSI